jgi:hypothetical protein
VRATRSQSTTKHRPMPGRRPPTKYLHSSCNGVAGQYCLDNGHALRHRSRTTHHPPPTQRRFVIVHDQQHYNAVNKAVVDTHQQVQLYEYFCYDGIVADEATSHDASIVEDCCYSDASVSTTGNLLTSLNEQLENHYHIEVSFNVKLHQDLLVIIA